MTFEQIPFCPAEMLTGMVKPWQHRFREKNLALTLALAPDMPAMVEGDPCRLRQVVDNLVGNALKFTVRGEVGITVDGKALDDRQTELRVAVRDSGIGISPDKMRIIFEPFVQADSSTTRRYGGAGLGLSISQRIVNQMGGRLWVESRPGEGSTFHFTVRLALPELQPAHLSPPPHCARPSGAA
jgi:signal transduction histidine kinase